MEDKERCTRSGYDITFNWSPIPGYAVPLQHSEEELIYLAAKICHGGTYKDNFIVKYPIWTEEKKRRLFMFLLKHKHMKPFDFGTITFEICCPIFVERQLRVYRTATIIERSLRSCPPMEFDYMTDPFAGCEVENKEAFITYKKLIDEKEHRELARRVLPLSTFTRVLFSINVSNLLHVFEERLTEQAQLETRLYCQSMWHSFEDLFPTVASVFKELNPNLLYGEN